MEFQFTMSPELSSLFAWASILNAVVSMVGLGIALYFVTKKPRRPIATPC